MILFSLLLPSIIMFASSYWQNTRVRLVLPLTSAIILLPIIALFQLPKPFHIWGNYLIADNLNTYVLLTAAIVSIGVTLALMTLDKHVNVKHKDYIRFYRLFAVFWIGLIFSILANHMGLYWIGLELATLATVYMIKTNHSPIAHREAWNYMIVGTIAVSLILFGIILIYASAKPILGEDAMFFSSLQSVANQIQSPFLFEIGFAIVTMGMFIKMGFFPMNLWLANIERSAFYPVAALFSGILEGAIIIGFFRFSLIAMQVNYTHLLGFIFIYTLLTLFIVAFLIYRAKDFIRLFSLSGVEHMALIALFWVSGGYFAALLHFGAHAFLKPALFLSTGVLESQGRYRFAGALRGYSGKKGEAFWLLVSLLFLGIISLPPSPMFFSELNGFSALVQLAKHSDHMLAMILGILILLILLAVIFYRFVSIYQSMKYEGKDIQKTVYTSELLALGIFVIALIILLLPQSIHFLQGIQA